MINQVVNELNKIGLNNIDSYSVIKESKETILYKITYKHKQYVMKYFLDKNNAFEIHWYEVLKDLGVKTMDFIYHTDKMIVFYDLDCNPLYRFGIETDLNNPSIAYYLGKWFKIFHQNGYRYLANNNMPGKNEFDYVSQKSIERLANSIQDNHGTNELLSEYFPMIERLFNSFRKTFVYRDFWFVNFVVSIDESEVFIYDFDKSGIGLAYSDILYMKMCLSESAQKAFMCGYGKIETTELEIATLYLDLFRLIYYFEHDYIEDENPPGWVQHHLNKYLSGELKQSIQKLII